MTEEESERRGRELNRAQWLNRRAGVPNELITVIGNGITMRFNPEMTINSRKRKLVGECNCVLKMETMYDQYDEIQLQLECKDDMDAQLSERNDFESIYYKALSKVHGMLTDDSKSTEQANSASFRASTCCKSDKLPTIQLARVS
ncbi:hypothetical protein EVAR_100511_1 [Eumeta japonica]|uniref:Uncharacterized protein n=1 Tax=Eumeta variegata TaxID=151549 RepID=A0A4C2AA72_EUMVA|nr:hypothetical protein EVAR_100511_1 [Eumeta japonica]